MLKAQSYKKVKEYKVYKGETCLTIKKLVKFRIFFVNRASEWAKYFMWTNKTERYYSCAASKYVRKVVLSTQKTKYIRLNILVWMIIYKI